MVILTGAQMKEAERLAGENGISSAEMMELAGEAVFRCIERREVNLENKKSVVCCGNGNNGGDGFVVARMLMDAGVSVITVLVDGNPRTPEAIAMYELIYNRGGLIWRLGEETNALNQAILDCDFLVDGVFGTGFRGQLPEKLGGVVQMANMSHCRVYAIDLPSGIEGDSGFVNGRCFEAEATIALGALKPAHVTEHQEEFVGQVEVVDIGIGADIFSQLDCHLFLADSKLAYAPLQKRPRYSHKGNFGKLLCFCGSREMLGAALLSGEAAYRTGVGLVTLAIPKSRTAPAFARLPEAVLLPLEETPEGQVARENLATLMATLATCSAGLLGCGLGFSPETEEIVCEIVTNSHCPLVLDGDALTILAQNKEILRARIAPLVLTPHPGEMARLTGKTILEISQNRTEIARAFAEDYQVTVVLKGANTVVASPNGDVTINSSGNPGLAKAGSGDLLAGTIASLLAQRHNPVSAAVSGTFLHGLAGDLTARRLGQYAMLATDVLANYPQVFLPCDTGRDCL